MMVWLLWLLLVVSSLLLSAISPLLLSAVALLVASLAVFISSVRRLRVLEGTFAVLAVDEDPAAVTFIPFGDPWIGNLRWASIGLRLVLAVRASRFIVVVRHLEGF
jgi:hypothetical protein